jgi:flagellar biosynthetic protein FliO
MAQQLLAVLLVLALLGAALWLLRRKGVAKVNVGFARRTTSARKLEVVDRIALTTHHSLHLVRVEDRTILIGVSPSGCTHLETLAADGKAEEKTNA